MTGVSILMAVHNGLPYLPQAIRSVLAQPFSDFEFVIVDDGSTDGTPDHVRSYRDERIRLLYNTQRMGQTRSLNLGLHECRGTYVARLDADDVCLPERLQRQVEFLDAHPQIAVVGSRMIGIDAAGRQTERFGRLVHDRATFVAWLLLGVCPLGHPSVMFRRQAVDEVGGYDERYRIGQDYDLWIRMAQRGQTAFVLPERLVMYRTHPSQQSVEARVAHRGELHAIHECLVQQYCPAGHVAQVTRILRLDDLFWSTCVSRHEVSAAAAALEETITQACLALKLTNAEADVVRRIVYRWVGLGVRLAPRLVDWPSWVYYPAVASLSPLLIPNCRQGLATASRWARQCRRLLRRPFSKPSASATKRAVMSIWSGTMT